MGRSANGKADRDYVYQREFMKGTTHKATGMVRYTLEDLGGEGWIVAKDRRRIRSLVRLEVLTWTDEGETSPSDVLRVVKADSWDGGRCPRCELGVILEGESQCALCSRDDEDRERVASESVDMPEVEPF